MSGDVELVHKRIRASDASHDDRSICGSAGYTTLRWHKTTCAACLKHRKKGGKRR